MIRWHLSLTWPRARVQSHTWVGSSVQPSFLLTKRRSFATGRNFEAMACDLSSEKEMMGSEESEANVDYHSHDFEWESLRLEIESSDFYSRMMGGVSDGSEVMEEAGAAQTAWESFHRRHSEGLFFKERRYLLKEFPELSNQVKSLKILEIGCGNGSTIIPILRANKAATVYACDLSHKALKAAEERLGAAGIDTFDAAKLRFFCCDLSTQELPCWLCCSSCRMSPSQENVFPPLLTHRDNFSQVMGDCLIKDFGALQNSDDQSNPVGICRAASIDELLCFGNLCSSTNNEKPPIEEDKACIKENVPQESIPVACVGTSVQPASLSCCGRGVDIVTLIFTLSAVPLTKMANVLRESFCVLRPGGSLLFRDYGLYDMTMLRFSPSQQVANRLFRRSDGTLAYYFSIEEISKLCKAAGFIEEEARYCCVNIWNRKRNLLMKRVWVHGRFLKPKALMNTNCK